MSTIVKHIPHTVDLNEPVKKTYIDTLLATEDNLAHRFDITLLQGGQAVAMPSGAAVTAYFIRYSDNATVPITNGAVNGNVASVTLTKACYNKPGQFALIIKVSGGGIVNTVFYGEGTVYTSSTDKVVNDENIVPTLADLLAQIAAMEAGTAAANTATNRANAAANRCEQMQIDASGMAGDSNKLGGKAPEYYLQPVNLLDNSDFTDPVYQAGLGGMHGNIGYALDRWVYNRVSSTLSLNDGQGLSFLADEGVIYQKVAHGGIMNGKTYTLAIWTSDGNPHCITLESGYKAIGTSGYRACHAGENVVYINNGGEELPIAHVALYEGVFTAETLPPYVPKGYVAELAECQRYYRKIPSFTKWCSGYVSNGKLYYSIDFPEMRTTPTVASTGLTYCAANGVSAEASNTICSPHGKNYIVCEGAVSITTYNCVTARPAFDIELSADL